MTKPFPVSDLELLERTAELVRSERAVVADVVEHLAEVDRRRAYLDAACRSLSCYCIERLGYSEDEARKRVQVARLGRRFPQVLEELRAGLIHMTGLSLLAPVLTEDNAPALLAEARGKSRSQIEALIARHFPKPDVAERVCPQPEQIAAIVGDLLATPRATLLATVSTSADAPEVVASRIVVPTLVIGARQSVFPAESQAWIAKQIPGARLEIFEVDEGGSHFMFMENPVRFNAIVRDFLRA